MKHLKAILSAAVALTLVACGSGDSRSDQTGGIRTVVQIASQSRASDVAAVTVSIRSSDPGYVIAPITLTAGASSYTGEFPQLRASTNGGPTYDLVAEAKDAADTVLYRGEAKKVSVTEGTMTTISIVANSTEPVAHTDFVPVRITAVQANNIVRSGEKLTFKVFRNEDATGPVTVSWTTDGSGTFSNSASDLTEWTAPQTTIFLTEHITVSVSNGPGAASQFTFDVNISAKVDAPVEVTLNDPPTITSLALSAPRIAPGDQVTLTVDASDANGDTLSYTFKRGNCDASLPAGVEGVEQATEVADFTAGSTVGTCQLAVTVSDGKGGIAEGSVVLSIDATPPVRIFVVTPTDPSTLANVTGVADDGAPGMLSGSIAATGTPKAELYFSPTLLFGRPVKLGDIAGMSYFTKKATAHDVEPADWALTLYTVKYPDQVSGWYGARVGAEPYLSANRNETAGAWNEWSTDGAQNQLRFFESTGNAYFGGYTDPNWSSFLSTTSKGGVAFADQELLYFTIQTASSAVGFDGQLDGVRIKLTDGSVTVIDFQP